MSLSTEIEALYDESEKRENFGLCPLCEDDAFEDGDPNYSKVLCYVCGVCFKYHHQDWCEMPVEDPDEAFMLVEDKDAA